MRFGRIGIMKNPWKTLSSKTVYQNPWITVREDEVVHPDGRQGIYGVVESKPSIGIVAVTNENKIIFIELVRYTNQIPSIEIPAGGSDGEDIILAAKRELKEETGYTANKLKVIGKYYPMNGIFSEICYTIIATGLNKLLDNEQREEGITKVYELSFGEVLEKINNGEITDGQTIASLMQAFNYLKIIYKQDNI